MEKVKSLEEGEIGKVQKVQEVGGTTDYGWEWNNFAAA